MCSMRLYLQEMKDGGVSNASHERSFLATKNLQKQVFCVYRHIVDMTEKAWCV